MSRADGDLDQRLRAALHREADALPYAPDLSPGAIERAGTIRRQRGVTGAAALVALLAVAVPVGLAATGGSSQTAPEPPTAEEVVGPAQVRIDLDALPAGEQPSVPYAQNGVMFLADGAGTTDFQSLDWYSALAWGDKAVVTGLQDGPPQLYLYDSASQQAQDVLVEQGAESTVVSADRRWLAYVDLGEAGAPGTITVADAETRRSDEFQFAEPYAYVLAVVDGTVFYLAPGGPQLRSWSQAEGGRSYPYRADMVSDDGSLAARVTRRTELGACRELVELASDEARWRTCDWAPAAVSPDGQWVYATLPPVDGYGSAAAAVLDAETGEVVRELRCEGHQGNVGVFRDAVWESADTLLLQVESGGQAALMRLEVTTGEAELATEPVPHDGIDDPVRPPYLLG